MDNYNLIMMPNPKIKKKKDAAIVIIYIDTFLNPKKQASSYMGSSWARDCWGRGGREGALLLFLTQVCDVYMYAVKREWENWIKRSPSSSPQKGTRVNLGGLANMSFYSV